MRKGMGHTALSQYNKLVSWMNHIIKHIYILNGNLEESKVDIIVGFSA